RRGGYPASQEQRRDDLERRAAARGARRSPGREPGAARRYGEGRANADGVGRARRANPAARADGLSGERRADGEARQRHVHQAGDEAERNDATGNQADDDDEARRPQAGRDADDGPAFTLSKARARFTGELVYTSVDATD